jgi:hypothetical protein
MLTQPGSAVLGRGHIPDADDIFFAVGGDRIPDHGSFCVGADHIPDNISGDRGRRSGRSRGSPDRRQVGLRVVGDTAGAAAERLVERAKAWAEQHGS